MSFINRNKFGYVLLLAQCLLSSVNNAAWALKSDSDQPILIESNSATFDDATGVSVYVGDVEVKQGSMRMTSNKLIIYLNNGDVAKLVAKGTPARFRQTPSPGKKDIKGKSLRAEYYPKKSLLLLIKEAVVWQEDNTYASDIIEYDNKNAIVKAGEASTDSKRVHVVLQPKKNNKQ